MPSVGGVGTGRVEGTGAAETPEVRGTPAGAPELPDDGALYGMGLDVVAAALASKSAETTLKVAREGQRAAKMEQAAELRAQAQTMREKAHETRLQAWTSGSISIASGAMSFGGAAMHDNSQSGGAASRMWTAGGTGAGALAQPAGTLNGGARAIELESDSNVHASRAKTAEGVAEEFANLERQSKSIIEKATNVIQSLLAERQATTRAILRTG